PTLQELNVTVKEARMCNSGRFWRGRIGPATICCFQGQRRGSAPARVEVPVPCPRVHPRCSPLPLVCGKRPAVAGVVSFSSQKATDPFKPPWPPRPSKKWIQKTLR
ncbi:GRAM protein, partial [Urocynchramus pylzowi]|nr:GRAM protein [Urocynchramus pylzowi]